MTVWKVAANPKWRILRKLVYVCMALAFGGMVCLITGNLWVKASMGKKIIEGD